MPHSHQSFHKKKNAWVTRQMDAFLLPPTIHQPSTWPLVSVRNNCDLWPWFCLPTANGQHASHPIPVLPNGRGEGFYRVSKGEQPSLTHSLTHSHARSLLRRWKRRESDRRQLERLGLELCVPIERNQRYFAEFCEVYCFSKTIRLSWGKLCWRTAWISENTAICAGIWAIFVWIPAFFAEIPVFFIFLAESFHLDGLAIYSSKGQDNFYVTYPFLISTIIFQNFYFIDLKNAFIHSALHNLIIHTST